MDQLNDFISAELRDPNLSNEPTRSVLAIDLNEIPSPPETLPDSFDFVRSFHDNPSLPSGDPAGLPEASSGSLCAACGKPEVRELVVVCDGCERGFHLSCAGMRGHQLLSLEEWVCGECVSNGVKSKRWPLGVKSKLILDINASPPSDVDMEGPEEVLDLRKHHVDGNSFSGNPFTPPVTYSNFLFTGNGFGLQKASGIVAHAVKVGCEDILNPSQTTGRSPDDDFSFPLGRCRNSNNPAIRLPYRNPNEIFLQALREFISDKHGVLEEGWRVEFKMGSCEVYAVYCAPDGRTFDSVYEVACHLGLMSNCRSKESEMRNEGSASMSEKIHLSRKRKASRFPVVNGFAENWETSVGARCKEPLTNGCNKGVYPSTHGINAKLEEVDKDELLGSFSQQNNKALPVQFKDFFVLSLGKVDTRPSYHDINVTWPVGYRSCWHDKVTGSLFICEVLDGGDSGPVFTVRRCSCSAFPIPKASTVLTSPQHGKLSSQIVEESCGMPWDSDGDIHMFLFDPITPTENDILSCLRSKIVKASDFLASNMLRAESSSMREESEDLSLHERGLCDEIGEISVQEHSSPLAWSTISDKFMNACSKILKQKGTVKFFCEHAGNDEDSMHWLMVDENNKVNFSSLDRYCGVPSSFSIPSVIQANSELNTTYGLLAKWLDQDRFGLDVEFVQEIVEHLPGIECCSQYHPLSGRNSYSTSMTIGNGLLILRTGDGLQGKEEEVLDVLFRRHKKARLAEGHGMDHQHPPTGKLLCSRVPSELVGDVYQVWELFWRFYEILGLKEPLTLEELEEELINPWLDSSELLEKYGKEIRSDQGPNSCRIDCTEGQILSSNTDSDLTISGEGPPEFIQVESGSGKESRAKLAPITYSRCFGVALTKAHTSMLVVLICELLSKVVSLVDPNFDSGESKSKRGRKKDVDSSFSVRRSKLNMLPINEFTWPELARRYILGVLSMDGNQDSAEVASRESGKVFRCLQGDGGVLCGSFTGVAGMEADALLLAEATKQIYGSVERENSVITIEDEESDATGPNGKESMDDGNIPEWAKMLEPVRKLPTNVGTRIRKCVYDALDKNPPDWAKKILEHSISKEVYKGNASGPTKKAVLSVLAELCSEGLPQKSEKRRKKKTVITISDIVMIQCRIVLRCAAAADDAKVFCNLLGRKLISSSDNDDEGLLGSPAMVSRPLDFRTIDLRLAAGAYGGVHEAFLEDVRELWSNVRNAFADQPDLVDLAESLSQNFESLYDKEVITLVNKLAEYATVECLSAEKKKEIYDLLSSTSDIPKAPWDEGVCKVCGIDRDDDSVLLCDTCDAEYHTYCLSPPLARIPEGNWYCPSCVVGKRMVQDASENSQVISRPTAKKHQGEPTRVSLEALAQLAAKMEENEYWECTIDERTFLLKFLCDELLNSAVIHHHLEQCAEISAELQQKLRSFSAEWKNLKSREEMLVARAVKLDPKILNVHGEGFSASHANHEKYVGQVQALNDRPNNSGIMADNEPTPGGGQELIGPNGCDRLTSVPTPEYHSQNQSDAESQHKDVNAAVDESKVTSSHFANTNCQKNDQSCGQTELDVSNSLPHEIESSDREIHSPVTSQEYKGNDASSLPQLDQHEHLIPLDTRSTDASQHVPLAAMTESQVCFSELNSVKTDILLLQESITSVEWELLKVSIRREFLGSDSMGHLYWSSAAPGGHSRIIVDRSSLPQNRAKVTDCKISVAQSSVLHSSVPLVMSSHLPLERSKACCPYPYEPNNCNTVVSPWVFYESDAEISKLIGWLNNNDPKERVLKESILHWQKLRFLQFQQNRNPTQDGPTISVAEGEKPSFDCVATRAATLLERRHGPCFDLEYADILKKRGKKARVAKDEKMYRCECLELILPSRQHCLSCHRTFIHDVDLDGHNDGRCNLISPANEKGKEIINCSKVKGSKKFGSSREELTGEVNRVETSKTRLSEFNAKLIKFQNEGLVCPFDFEDICSKFVTKDSNEDLIQEIGLIGSKGIPSFVPSVCPCLSDSTLALASSRKDIVVQSDRVPSTETISIGNTNVSITSHDTSSARSPGRSTNEFGEVLKSQRSASTYHDQRDKAPFLDGHASVLGVGHCCVVPQSSLRPVVGKVSQIFRQLKINLLDMDAALPEEAIRPSKTHTRRRWAWREFVKSARTIYQMVQATIVLEDMIKTDYLRNEWWYWSSFSAAAKTSTMSSLALRIYSLDAAVIYEKMSTSSDPPDNLETSSMHEQKPVSDATDRTKVSRKSNRKRKDPDG